MADFPDDWRCKCVNVAQMQFHARKYNLFTDVKLCVGKGESQQVFPAHKTVLAFGSEVFEKMFFGPIAETKDTIEFSDDDPEAFDRLLRCIYGVDVPFESFTIAWKCHMIGDKYFMYKLQDKASEFVLKHEMDDDNFWEIINNNIFSSPIIKDKFDKYVQSNAYKILASEQFLNVSEDVVQHILQMNELNIHECNLLKFITVWANNKLGAEANPENLLPLFKHIRFSTLTIKQFCSFTDSFPSALDKHNSLEILKHLLDKSFYKLPSWCSTSNTLRDWRHQPRLSIIKL